MKKKTIAATCLAATMSLFASAHDVIDFCGGWTFKKAPSTTETMQAAAAWNGRWDSVSVPHTWNATDMLTRVNNFYAGAAYYRKHFSVPSSWKDKVLYLRFEGVASCAEVYVNGKLVATHKGVIRLSPATSAETCATDRATKSWLKPTTAPAPT